MRHPILSAPAGDDTELVAQSLGGSRDAFGRIVERYQSLVCALAFSATGSVSRSEDLAQETFLTAWLQLRTLRDPAKLRAWLCGVARNIIHADRRKQGREPSYQAAHLADTDELSAPEPAPLNQAITNEELALLWREIGQLPEMYRETLVLYYREHQSVALVAEGLELSEDAVMQRLSRGRKLLHERMLALVETALDRTNPGRNFALGVQASLPLLAVGSQAAGVTSAKGIALKGGGGLSALALPVIGMLAALGVSWAAIRQAPNAAERRYTRNWHVALWISIGTLILALRGVAGIAEHFDWSLRITAATHVGIWFSYLLVLTTLLVLLYRHEAAGHQDTRGAAQGDRGGPNWPLMLAGTYIASTAWIIGLTWLMGDTLVAVFIAGGTVVLATWNIRKVRKASPAAAHRTIMICHASLCGMLLLIANLRIAFWVAPLYGVSVDEMARLLPMTAIHLLSGFLVCWAAVLLALLQRKDTSVVDLG